MSDYSSNHSKITGEFAENLVLYCLSKEGYECVMVRHIGIDIIASKGGKSFGISVKSRSRKDYQTGPSFNKFTITKPKKHIQDIKKACLDFNCISFFAFVLDKEKSIDVVLTPLANIEKVYTNIGDQSSQDWDMMKFYQEDGSITFKLSWENENKQRTPESLYKHFIDLLSTEFPDVKYNYVPTQNRTSPYVPNERKDKRWMQIDIQTNCLSVVMDHVAGEITDEDLRSLGIPVGLAPNKTTVQFNSNRDHVRMTIYPDVFYDVQRPEFVSFVHKHYASYLRRVDLTL
jgi:hypothetical protein